MQLVTQTAAGAHGTMAPGVVEIEPSVVTLSDGLGGVV
jgi:hypothetical protein